MVYHSSSSRVKSKLKINLDSLQKSTYKIHFKNRFFSYINPKKMSDHDEAQSLLHQKEEQDKSPLTKYIWFYSIFVILNLSEFIILQFVFGFEEINRKYPVGSFLVYLTNLHGIFQTFYYSICIIEGIFFTRSEWVRLKIPRIRHWIFGSIAFPFANFVGCKKIILIEF
jgi:hypothetical protein